MDTVAEYRTIVQHLIHDVAQFIPSHGNITPYALYDEENDQYTVINAGWNGPRRVYNVILHIRLQDEKIWIEHDGSPPPGAADALIERGIPQQAIVLAFHPPEVRALSGFAA